MNSDLSDIVKHWWNKEKAALQFLLRDSFLDQYSLIFCYYILAYILAIQNYSLNPKIFYWIDIRNN